MAPSPHLAPSLIELGRELKREFPKRDTSTDGWLGDPAHAARKSEHNPDGKGMVHARDIDTDGLTRAQKTRLLKSLIGDARVWYVIHDGVIWSRTHGWKALRYTGENPHTHHIHVSIRLTAAAERGTKTWLKEAVVVAKKAPAKKVAPAKKAPVKATAPAPAKAAAPAKKAPAKKAPAPPPAEPAQLERGDKGEAVAFVQRFLGIADDGIFGPVTEKAVKRWQKMRGYQPTGVLTPRQGQLMKDAAA